MEPPNLAHSTSLGASAAAEFAECAYCFEPLPAATLCVLRGASGIRGGRAPRVCRHIHHLDCMRRDAAYVRQHGGRELRCPLCNAAYSSVIALPARDIPALFAAVAPSRGGGLTAQEAKELLRAMLWRDGGAIERLVDEPWREAVGHEGVANAGELLRLIRMAGSCAGRMLDARPPLLVDDAAGWFDFWAGEDLVLTRDALARALVKTFGDETDDSRAAVFSVWGLFCGEADSIGRAGFLADDGMADALVLALASMRAPTAPSESSASAPPGHWSCGRCTLHNRDSATECAACGFQPRVRLQPASSDDSVPARLLQLPGGIPGCRSPLEPDRVRDDISAPTRSCARCRRKPPFGAAVWRCDCGAAFCIRCATVDRNFMQRVNHEAFASAAGPAPEPELPAASLMQDGPSIAAAPTEFPPEDIVECPNCRRRRQPAGVPMGRCARWCQCHAALSARRGDAPEQQSAEADAAAPAEQAMPEALAPTEQTTSAPGPADQEPPESAGPTAPTVSTGAAGATAAMRTLVLICASFSEDGRSSKTPRCYWHPRRTPRPQLTLQSKPCGQPT